MSCMYTCVNVSKATPSRLIVSHFPPASYFATSWIDSLCHYWWHQAAKVYDGAGKQLCSEPTICIALAICMNKGTHLSNQGNVSNLKHTCQCGFRVMNNE